MRDKQAKWNLGQTRVHLEIIFSFQFFKSRGEKSQNQLSWKKAVVWFLGVNTTQHWLSYKGEKQPFDFSTKERKVIRSGTAVFWHFMWSMLLLTYWRILEVIEILLQFTLWMPALSVCMHTQKRERKKKKQHSLTRSLCTRSGEVNLPLPTSLLKFHKDLICKGVSSQSPFCMHSFPCVNTCKFIFHALAIKTVICMCTLKLLSTKIISEDAPNAEALGHIPLWLALVLFSWLWVLGWWYAAQEVIQVISCLNV